MFVYESVSVAPVQQWDAVEEIDTPYARIFETNFWYSDDTGCMQLMCMAVLVHSGIV